MSKYFVNVRKSVLAGSLSLLPLAMGHNAQTLTLYATPHLKAEKIITLHQPSQLQILPSNWIFVKDMKTGKTGWLNRQALSKVFGQAIQIQQSLMTPHASLIPYNTLNAEAVMHEMAQQRARMLKNMQQELLWMQQWHTTPQLWQVPHRQNTFQRTTIEMDDRQAPYFKQISTISYEKNSAAEQPTIITIRTESLPKNMQTKKTKSKKTWRESVQAWFAKPDAQTSNSAQKK